MALPTHTAEVSDTFTRADNASLGSPWENIVGTFAVSSGKAVVTSATGYCHARYNVALSSPDQYATVTVNKGTGTLLQGPMVRVNPTTRYGYYWFAQAQSPQYVGRMENSTYVDVGTSPGLSISEGDTLTLTAEGTGATVTLKGYQNGNLIFTLVDSSANRLLSGVAGIGGYYTAEQFDNFEAGILGTGAPAAPAFRPKVIIF